MKYFSSSSLVSFPVLLPHSVPTFSLSNLLYFSLSLSFLPFALSRSKLSPSARPTGDPGLWKERAERAETPSPPSYLHPHLMLNNNNNNTSNNNNNNNNDRDSKPMLPPPSIPNG